MNKQEFQALKIEEQINFINKNLKLGISISRTCREIGISKSVANKYKSHNYIIVDNQYTLTPPSTSPNQQEVATDIISTPKVKSVKKPIIGRPKRTTKFKKITTEIDFILYKQLKHYCIDNEINMNKYIEELLRKNLK